MIKIILPCVIVLVALVLLFIRCDKRFLKLVCRLFGWILLVLWFFIGDYGGADLAQKYFKLLREKFILGLGVGVAVFAAVLLIRWLAVNLKDIRNHTFVADKAAPQAPKRRFGKTADDMKRPAPEKTSGTTPHGYTVNGMHFDDRGSARLYVSQFSYMDDSWIKPEF